MSVRAGFLVMYVAAGVPGQGKAATFAQQVAQGEALFQQRCTACHTIGQGERVGPDLAGVSQRRDRAWLIRWVTAPDQVLATGDPIAKELLAQYRNLPMPNMGLSADQAAAVLAFVDAGGSAAAAGAPALAALPPGDGNVGKELFTSSRRFQNGGPPCMACHSIAGVGALGGGALGPDLTGARTKYGAGLASVLANIPFPTMQPIFAGHPLTPQEQADLVAFLEQPLVVRPSRAIARLTLLGAAGAILLLGLAQVAWRKRLRSVRKPLLVSARLRPHRMRVHNP